MLGEGLRHFPIGEMRRIQLDILSTTDGTRDQLAMLGRRGFVMLATDDQRRRGDTREP